MDDSVLKMRQAKLMSRTLKVEKSILAKELDAVAKGKPLDDVVKNAMKNQKLMAQVMNRIRGNEPARTAMRRAVWDQVIDLPPGNLVEFIDSNNTMLRVAGMKPEHLEALKTIDAMRTIVARVPKPKGSGEATGFISALERRLGINLATFANRWHSWMTGRTEKAWLAVNVITNIVNRKSKDAIGDAWAVVLYDPEAAIALSQSLKAGADGPYAKRLGARFFAFGMTPFREDRDESRRQDR